MKRQTINFSWPATLSFSADNGNENERFSRGQLKVFYKGETKDHRYFSDKFSEELVKSLPYTPIVSYYDEEKDDFVGHATEQAIYGIVDPCGNVSFEKDDDGVEWCVCDTVMYTERPDKVGEIAKKIEGHSQSLELDPNTAKYVVNYDEKRHFKNIEFTDGHFVGVSVLGKDQKPAFTGSEFFSADINFEDKMKLLKQYCEKSQQTQSGGNEMNLQEFMTLSWGDKSRKVAEAVESAYKQEYYCYIIDMFDDCTIGKFYSYIDGSIKLLRVKYTIDENGVVTLGEANEVHVVYEDVPAPASTQATLDDDGVDNNTEPSTVTNAEEQTEGNTAPENAPVANPEQATEQTPVTEPEIPTTPEQATEQTPVTEPEVPAVPEQAADQTPAVEPVLTDAAVSSETSAENAAQMTNAQSTNLEKVGPVNEQKQEENSSFAPLTESERAEFETLKREKKENLINSYKENLSEELINGFFATIDSVSYEELETNLLKEYKKAQEEDVSKKTKVGRAFSLASLLSRNETQESSLVSQIKANLHRD